MKLRLITITLFLYLNNSILAATNLDCTSTTPLQIEDCIINTSATHNCCYKVSNFGLTKSCVTIEKTSTFNPILTEDGEKSFIDCGPVGASNSNTSNQPGQTTDVNENSLKLPYKVCGVVDPKIASDCNSYSVYGNSCCLYESQGNTGCYWLGKTYFGEANYDNMIVTCTSDILKTYGLLIISFMIFILF